MSDCKQNKNKTKQNKTLKKKKQTTPKVITDRQQLGLTTPFLKGRNKNLEKKD